MLVTKTDDTCYVWWASKNYFIKNCPILCLKKFSENHAHLPLSLPTPHTRIVWIGCEFKIVKFSGSISLRAPSSKSKNKSLPYIKRHSTLVNGYAIKAHLLTSPQRPTTSSKSFLPNDKSRMHLFTAFDERSGVKSSSAISTQPNDRTANRMGLSTSCFNG